MTSIDICHYQLNSCWSLREICNSRRLTPPGVRWTLVYVNENFIHKVACKVSARHWVWMIGDDDLLMQAASSWYSYQFVHPFGDLSLALVGFHSWLRYLEMARDPRAPFTHENILIPICTSLYCQSKYPGVWKCKSAQALTCPISERSMTP